MIKLKSLIENVEDSKPQSSLSLEEKNKMYETIKLYNEYRGSLKAECIYETIQKISDAIDLAERYALKESSDWMESKMIKEDIKEMKKLTDSMYKESYKIKQVEKQMEMLYEQLGMKLERYFEIAEKVQ